MTNLSAMPAKLVLFHTQTVTFPRSKIVPQKTNCTVLTFFYKKEQTLDVQQANNHNREIEN